MKTKLTFRTGTRVQGKTHKTMSHLSAELHRPVMLQRCLELLRPALQGDAPVVVDATLGLGGHSEALLEQNPNLNLIGLDRDPKALELAKERLEKFGDRFEAVEAIYDELDQVLEERKIAAIQGALFDLGVSSMQLDEAGRGFSYAQDAPLDMRMDQSTGESAAELLARLSVDELAKIFRIYGEERFAFPIAKEIDKVRQQKPIATSTELNEIVERVVPKAPGKQTGHPAKRVYQALRIAVNDELQVLERALPMAIDALEVGGRIVVMSYHSLEDGLVKRAFQQRAVSSTPVDMPIELPGTSPSLKVLTKGVERATEIELSQNPRAASARLRAAEKLEVA